MGPFFKQVSEKSDIESAADITPGSSSIKDSDPTDDVAEATVDYPTQPSPTGSFAGAPESWPKADHSATITFDYASTSDRSSVTDLLSGSVRQGSRYTIESEIARGGMGAVVRAVDCDIRREVAIKYMLDDSDQGRKARFVEEAQITGQLEHPNIVPIHELGLDADKRLFFAMKLVNGRSLGQIVNELRKQPATAEKTWPLSRLLNIFVSICHALAYAHSRGVIHRDLKPANIMVGDFGEVYVMDWGLAKVIIRERQTPISPTSASVSLSEVSATRTRDRFWQLKFGQGLHESRSGRRTDARRCDHGDARIHVA